MAKINAVKKKKTRANYYKTGYTSEKFRDIPIDYSRSRMYEFELKQKYTDLGLRYYRSKAEFMSKNPNLKAKADEYWKQYKMRDELIARGQYEGARAMLYMNAHIKKLEELLGVAQGDNPVLSNIVHNLKQVPYEKLTDLIGISSGERGSLTTYLPNIGDIYLLEGTIPSKEASELLGIGKDEFNVRQDKLLADYQRAFEMAGISWDYEDAKYSYNTDNDLSQRQEEYRVRQNKKRLRYNERYNTNLTFSDFEDRRNIIENYKGKHNTALQQAFGLVQERTTNKVYGYPNTNDMRNIVLDYYKSHTKYIRTTKSGRQYVPFTKRSISDYIIKNLK